MTDSTQNPETSNFDNPALDQPEDQAPEAQAGDTAPAAAATGEVQQEDGDRPSNAGMTSEAIMPTVQPQNVQAEPAGEPIMVPLDKDPIKNLNPVAIYGATAPVLDALDHYIPDEPPETPWFNNLERAESQDPEGEGYEALSDPDRNWRRVMEFDGKRLGTRDMGVPVAARAYTGNSALQVYRSFTTGSSGSNVVHWGSGVSVKFDKLDNRALYAMAHAINSERVAVGRSTFGLALSSHMTYTVEAVMEAARKARSSASVRPDVDLGDALRLTDFPTLTWGLAQATFSDGIPLARACTASPTTCNHVAETRAMPRRMWLVDDASISEDQRRWVALLRDNQHSLTDLQAYQDHFPRLRSREYDIKTSTGNVVKFTLRVPTINEYIQTGKIWIDEINRAVVTSIGENASFKARNAMMVDLMKAATARQYTHWVEKISFGDAEPLTNTEDITTILGSAVSTDDVQLVSFYEAVTDFHRSVTTTQIVTPNYRCPACNKHQMHVPGTTPEQEQPPLYVPLEAVGTFFALTYRRLMEVNRH